MRIGITALADGARRWWGMSRDIVAQSMERLGSGLRINHAVDDAAGLAISEGLTTRLNGYEQGMRNAQEALNLAATAEAGLGSMHDMLQRMRTLAVQAANGTYGPQDREAMQNEVDALMSEIDGVVERTSFNGRALLDGSVSGLRVQVGPDAADGIFLDVASFDTVGLGLRDAGVLSAAGAAAMAVPTAPDPVVAGPTAPARTRPGKGKGKGAPAPASPSPTSPPPAAPSSGATATPGWAISVLDATSAREAMIAVDDAIWSVSRGRSELGAVQNRLEHSVRGSSVAQAATAAARSRLVDTDMAHEMSRLVRHQILGEAAAAMTAQAHATARRGFEELLF